MSTAIAQQTSQPRRGTLIRFNPQERWAVSGKTGTGKTVFVKWWASHWYSAGWPIVIVDIKRKFTELIERGQYAEKPELATLDQPYNITATGELVPGAQVMVYHPSVPGWEDKKLDRLFLAIMAHGNIVLIVDEVRGVADQSHASLGYQLIMTQGRQSNIPTINGFQKPVGIPTDLLEMSEWFAIFRQNNPEYREKLVKLTGFPEIMQRPELYYYWLANENWDEPVLMAPVPQGLQEHGAKTLGTSGSGSQYQAPTGSGQSRGKATMAPQGDQRPGMGKVADNPKAAHSHSRFHAGAGRRRP